MTDSAAAPDADDARRRAGAFDRPPLILFRSGFRAFFLLAGLQGAFAMALWTLWLSAPAGGALGAAADPVGWHAHEMLFGYTVAAAAGFLLTAVPNWTGTAAAKSWTIVLLATLWLAGRVGMWLAGIIPAWLTAALDLAFLPTLIAVLATALLPVRNRRNHVFLLLLSVWWLCSLLDHVAFMGLEPSGTYARRLAVDVAAIMMIIVGGRIVPSFTRNWLKARGRTDSVRVDTGLERVSILLAFLVMILHALGAWDWMVGLVALLAGVSVLWRLGRWSGFSTLSEPILFILHVGYGWIGFAFLLEAASLLADWVPYTTAWHAMTAGAVGTLTLAVMTRAALGHAGRPIVAAPLTIAAYVLVNMAALVRVFGPLIKPEGYTSLVVAAGWLWALAFICYLIVYVPLFLRPRADGKPG
ncbi:NnrS family protein [Caenispirillum salinarum]|uniref:NnrS family protein n=1 Tax=Caenispirillum salinarum TaxID=859058 RepID=UPI00384D4E63